MKRRNRYVRDREAGRKPFIMTSAKLDILRLLARYRYLRASHLAALLPNRSVQGLSRTLRQLFDHGYINKPKEQRRGYNDRYCPDIYEIDHKSIYALGDEQIEITRLYRQKTDGPAHNFAHSMMICDAMASIEIGLIDIGYDLISWQHIVARSDHPNPMKLPISIKYTFPDGEVERNDTFLVPDGLFGIRHPDGKASFFALEAEHFNPIEPTNLKRASFLKKLLGYRNIAETGVYKDQLKIPNLRVIVLAPTETRMHHQIELTERVAGQSNLFLFAHIAVQEELLKAPPPIVSLTQSRLLRAGIDPVALI